MTTQKILVLALFLGTYALIIRFYRWKALVAWGAVVALVATGVLTPARALGAVDWNVILLYFGMLFVSEVFLHSKMPGCLASRLASRTRSTAGAMVAICLFTGFLSIFLENVAVVLLAAPIAMSISRQCDIDPVPLFIGMAVSSNLQGAATLIGDPPSMLLAGFAGLTFNDFFVIDGKPGIFFAVQIAAVASAVVLYLVFRKYDKPMPPIAKESAVSTIPTLLVVLLIASLIVGSAIQHDIDILSGLLCCVFGLICMVWHIRRNGARDIRAFVKELDWMTGVFLVAIFVIVESLSAGGVLGDLAALILRVSGSSPFAAFLLVVWISVLVSAFVDNVPYLVAMLPVVTIITAQMPESRYALLFGLLIGASIGGNITPIGASANIVAMGIVRKQGHAPSFISFVRIGLPFTVVSVAASAAFLWLVFA